MKTQIQQKFGKRQIKKIAKEYGFWIEFSAIYGEGSWYTMFQRINKKEAHAYSMDKNEFGDPIDYVYGEEDRFENEEHCRAYFKHHEDRFLNANPSLKKIINIMKTTTKGEQKMGLTPEDYSLFTTITLKNSDLKKVYWYLKDILKEHPNTPDLKEILIEFEEQTKSTFSIT